MAFLIGANTIINNDGNLTVTGGRSNLSGVLNAYSANSNVVVNGNIVVTGGSINGTVSSATTAGTVTTNAQPNITSVGTLTGLTSGGVINFTSSSNVTLGPVSNVRITGGTSGQYLQTNGSGGLSWATVTSGATSSISNGTSNIRISTSGAPLLFSVAGRNVGNISSTTIAIGNNAGSLSGNIQTDWSIAIGENAAANASLGGNSIAIGTYVANNSTAADVIAIGAFAAGSAAGNSISIGSASGSLSGAGTISIGKNTGYTLGANSIHIGATDGQPGTSSGSNATVIGAQRTAVIGSNSVHIGFNTSGTGANSVHIGAFAGQGTSGTSNVIVINATGTNFGAPALTTTGLFIKPVSQRTNLSNSAILPAGFYQMGYNPTTGEVVYWGNIGT